MKSLNGSCRYPGRQFWRLSLAALVPTVLFLAGCASDAPNVISAENDPANPLAPSGNLSMAAMGADIPGGIPRAASMPAAPSADSRADLGGGMAMQMGNDAKGAPAEKDGMDMGGRPGPPKASAGKAVCGNKAIYTCPMHPDVISDQPGQCPKCGMTLIKNIQSGVSPESQ